MTYRITAQSFTTTKRIARTVEAASEAAALRLVGPQLDTAGFYPISVVAQQSREAV